MSEIDVSGRLSGKVAIVTGAGSTIGMGRSITLALIGAGAQVAMLDINEEALETSANHAREVGGDEAVLANIRGEVREFCAGFPLPH